MPVTAETNPRFCFDVLLREITDDIEQLTAELAAIRQVVSRINRNPRMEEVARQRLKELTTLWGAKRQGWIKRRNWDQKGITFRILHLQRLLISQRREFTQERARLETRAITLRQAIKAIKDRADLQKSVDISKMCMNALMGEPQ